MTNLSVSVPNLLGGVSQQPANLRFTNQVEVADNVLPSVAVGATRRPPAIYQGNLATAANDSTRFQSIEMDRGDAGQYAIFVGNDPSNVSNVQVYDLTTDQPCPVYGATGNTAPSYTYLTYSDQPVQPEDIGLLQVADTVLVYNRKKTVAQSGTTTTTGSTWIKTLSGVPYMKAACLWVRAGNQKTTYQADIKWGSNPASPTTSTVVVKSGNGTAAAIQPEITSYKADDIAEELRSDTDAVVGLAAVRGGTLVRIMPESAANAIIGLNAWDGQGDTAMVAINGSIENFDDLPSFFLHDYPVQIRGELESGVDDVYVKFVAVSPDTNSMGQGSWKETVAYGISVGFDASTMPHRITRHVDTDGSVTGVTNKVYFRFQPTTWTDRLVGSTVTNPMPSLVGGRVRCMTLFRDRLVMVTDNTIVMSQVNNYFNFFRTTVTQLLDGDPIDLTVVSQEAPRLFSAVPMNEQLLLLGTSQQWLVDGQPLLTPQSASIRPKLSLQLSDSIPDIRVDSAMVLGVSEGFTRVYDLTPVKSADEQILSVELTETCPKYLSGTPRQVLVSANQSAAVVLTSTADVGEAYLYKWYTEPGSRERLQSSWTRIKMGADTQIRGAMMTDEGLYILTTGGSGSVNGNNPPGHCISRVSFADGQVDDTLSNMQVHLDFRITELQCSAAASYNAGTNRTMYTLPFAVNVATSPITVCTRAVASPAQSAGTEIVPVAQTSTTVSLTGNTTASKIYIGVKYKTLLEFSAPAVREPQEVAAATRGAVLGGRWQILYMALSYLKSSRFTMRTTSAGRASIETTFTSSSSGLALETGNTTIPVFGRNTDVRVELENFTHMPCSWVEAEWQGRYTSRNVRRSRYS